MERYADKIRQILNDSHVEIVMESYAAIEGLRAVYARIDGKDRLIVDGCKAFQFDGVYEGGRMNRVKVCLMNHANRMILNKEFLYTAPTAFGREATTFGFGDRLGLAAPGQLAALKGTKVRPVLAQQSLRELSLTGRSYEDVIDAAAWAVFKTGYKDGYGADGDHLKTLEEVEVALAHGVSMVTLDCSLVLGDAPEEPGKRRAEYLALPQEYRERIEKEYLGADGPAGLDLRFTREGLERIVLVYKGAVNIAEDVQRVIKESGRKIDFEISLDETAYTTEAEAHYFVANEMQKAGVCVNSMAPKFVGEFHKAVDYIGDVDAFRKDIRTHCRIADSFGYKLSIHSGSDKFKVFQVIAQETEGWFHVKTSGTSWLEAVRVIAQTEPALYRDMHRVALDHFGEAKAYYVVHGKVENIKPLDETPDAELEKYLDADDSRQLLHITYGFMLRDDQKLRERIYAALEAHKEAYKEAVARHFQHHLRLLGAYSETAPV